MMGVVLGAGKKSEKQAHKKPSQEFGVLWILSCFFFGVFEPQEEGQQIPIKARVI